MILALENNRQIKNAYLDRIIQLETLAVAEDQFNPDVTPRIIVGGNRNDQGLSTFTQGRAELGATAEVLLPPGTRLSAGWTADSALENTIGLNPSSGDVVGQQISIEITQPLWRNAGRRVTRAPLQIARIQDEQNIFGLKTTVIDTITAAIQVYNALILAQQQVEIQQASLVSTEAELDRIEALIGAGRLAGIRRVEAEADVANRRVDVLDAENSLTDAQLDLIQALDIDQALVPVATETNGLDPESIQFADDNTLIEYALANNPGFRSSLLDLDIAAIELVQAEDQLGWDLDLVLGYNNTLNSRAAEVSDVRARVELSRELGDRSIKQRVVQQRVRIEQLENDRAENLDDLEISVRNALRDVAFQQTQVEQAQQATQLAERQLEITQVQFRRGTITFLDVVQAQDNLVNAQSRELSAEIAFQNALITLDQELGHTLETWNIQIEANEQMD